MAKDNFLTTKVDSCLRVSIWAGNRFSEVKNDCVTKWLAPAGLVGTNVAG